MLGKFTDIFLNSLVVRVQRIVWDNNSLIFYKMESISSDHLMLKGSELLAFDNTTCKIIQGEEIIFTAKISEMPNYVEEIEKTIKTENGWYIYECVTARRFRNRGYFKIALAHIGRKAEVLGKTTYICCLASNLPSKQAIESMGFIEVGYVRFVRIFSRLIWIKVHLNDNNIAIY